MTTRVKVGTIKSKPFGILTVQEMMGLQWHQMDSIKSFSLCSRQTTTPASHHSTFLTDWLLFLITARVLASQAEAIVDR